MSLFEVISMNIELRKLNGNKPETVKVSDEEHDDMMDRLRKIKGVKVI